MKHNFYHTSQTDTENIFQSSNLFFYIFLAFFCPSHHSLLFLHKPPFLMSFPNPWSLSKFIKCLLQFFPIYLSRKQTFSTIPYFASLYQRMFVTVFLVRWKNMCFRCLWIRHPVPDRWDFGIIWGSKLGVNIEGYVLLGLC